MMLVADHGGDIMLPMIATMRGAVFGRDGPDAAQEAGEEISDRQVN
jgi:hypothetical protein